MKRTLTIMIAAVLALAVLAGCGAKPQETYKKTAPAEPKPAEVKPVTIKLGMLPITEGLPFWLADQKGYFKDQNVTVEFVPFKSANERDAAIMSGAIDGMVSDLVAAATLVGSGTKVHAVSMSLGVTAAEAPMGILSSPKSNIKVAADLKGKEIAISSGSIMQYVAEKLLAENGLKPDDVKFVSIPQIPVRLDSLLSDKVAAAILPDPLFYLAGTNTKKAHVVLDNSKAKQNYYQSVIIMTDKAIADKAEGIKRMFTAYNRAVADLQNPPKADPDKTTFNNNLKDILGEKANLPAEIKAIYPVVPFSYATAPKKEDVESVLQWLTNKQLLKTKVTYEQMVNTTLLPK
ncbi:MAG TPA: MetQ/NlpA family ABC transporter substrate-binding protein [Symbiobacteriaceae bacterium]